MVRVLHPESCRDFAIENWEKIIPQAKEVLLQFAEESNDTDFLKIIEKEEPE